MISRIKGILLEASENTLVVDVNGLCYEVFIPTAIAKGLNGVLQKNTEVSFVTYHYYQTDPSKSIPILIGFSNAIEKEFFEKFITVSGVGPKAAVRALAMPIPDIAEAIDQGNLSYLKSLPGIGEQRAKEIIAKLQGKMAKFSLMRGAAGDAMRDGARTAAPGQADLCNEAIEVLIQLQYKKDEARQMVERAFGRKTALSSVEEVLNEVYAQKQSVKS